MLDSVSSPITKRVYNLGLDEFFEWFGQEPRPGFTKATVSAWRVSLEARGLGSSAVAARAAERPAPHDAASVTVVDARDRVGGRGEFGWRTWDLGGVLRRWGRHVAPGHVRQLVAQHHLAALGVDAAPAGRVLDRRDAGVGQHLSGDPLLFPKEAEEQAKLSGAEFCRIDIRSEQPSLLQDATVREADVVICMLSSGPVCDDVLLGSGKVLVAGGYDSSSDMSGPTIETNSPRRKNRTLTQSGPRAPGR